jgi:flagellar hook assembly protein FlgD
MTRLFAARHPGLSRALAATIFVVFVLLCAVWIAPRASGAAAAWIQSPSVRLHTLRPPGDGRLAVARQSARGAPAPVTLDAGSEFSMAGVTCDVPVAGSVTLRLRTSLDGAAWGPWLAAPLEVAGEGRSSTAYTDPLWTGAARYVQVEAARASRRGPSALSDVRLVAIDPTEDVSIAARVTGVARRLAATVAGVHFVSPASAASSAPVIVTRSEWGADESLRADAPSYAPVKVAIIHHTASGNLYSRSDAPALVRGIYAYHTRSLHWDDIAYNFLVDRFGTTYEGRYGGVTRGVVGAHVLGFNTGSTGISVIGTFIDDAPPAEAITAVERLLVWKLAVHGLDPSGTAKLACGATDKYAKGATVTFPVIAGHRQANSTECPGSAFYALLPSIRTAVARRMGSAVVATLSATRPLISPNGDGVLDATELVVGITTSADWQIAVKDEAGQTVASWSGQGAAAAVTWDGTSGGSDVPDGVYTAELTATLAGGDATGATTHVTIDTAAPRLAAASVSPASFSPNGDGQSETASVSYGPTEACSVRVGILDAGGDIVRWLQGWRAREVRSYAVKWDGRVSSGSGPVDAAEGVYRFAIERRDEAGNIARQGLKVILDRTLGHPTATPGTVSPDGDGARDTTRLGFTLTRKAAVTVRVVAGGQVVRTLALGALAAGARSAVWDGRAGSGEYLASSRPAITITAVSAIGETSVSKGLVVDLYRPRLYAAAGKTTAVGAATKLSCKAVDPFSAKVDVRYTVTAAGGRTVASGHPGWRPTGTSFSVTWKPASRGVYTVTYRAVDLGGNHEASVARTIVTVR